MSTPAPDSRVPEKPTIDGIEDRWAQVWEDQGTYRFDRTKSREEIYAIDTPPPTVSGSLHEQAGADGLASLTFAGIVDTAPVLDSNGHAVKSGGSALHYHVVDSHTLEGATAGGETIFTVTVKLPVALSLSASVTM